MDLISGLSAIDSALSVAAEQFCYKFMMSLKQRKNAGVRKAYGPGQLEAVL